MEKRPAHKARRRISDSPLSVLKVINRLEIGPVRLEKRRLVAPYTVVIGQKRDSCDLVYRYEEEVFVPGDPGSENLANMIASQAALNYGLFCDRIVFKGSFDRHDRRFIEKMAANTAREIFVKKFLEPNPFLLGKAANLHAAKQKSYLAAKLIFEGDELSEGTSDIWFGDPGKIAVLSSGGKDSLLSFALLSELGYETHPIYINESGRHWYTALNAYRYFRKTYANTARVWTNADRLFNWMLRRLPFVRQDFARYRADEYPIRLWTVAVFLFGALPLFRNRGLGRLVIGDEHDTTRRLNHHGIPHYDGLFDQSRYFDNAMTRYFNGKGWGIEQFSILRPLAEIMIERILALRYPRLQREQVSCHATHIKHGRVLPCGTCEKCRRIVGMLLALGVDPKRCGYTAGQIKSVLSELARTRLRQDTASAEHLAYLLTENGLISLAKNTAYKARRHPEIMRIMIDKNKSPIDEIPSDIRSGLIRIYREYTDGAPNRRQGGL